MSLFWDYFKNKLRWPLIWQPGPLAQVAQGGAGLLDDCREHILWLRDQFVPEKCEEEYLFEFAKARGISRWPTETDSLWRNRVVAAYKFYKQGGRLSSMQEFVALAGMAAEIRESADIGVEWSEAGGELLEGGWLDGAGDLSSPAGDFSFVTLGWAEFMMRVNAGEAELNASTIKLMQFLANEIKPARSRLIGIEFFVGFMFASKISGGPWSDRLITDYTECRSFAVPSFDIIGYGCEEIGGTYDADLLDGEGGLDGCGVINGLVAVGEPLNSSLGRWSGGMTSTGLFGMGAERVLDALDAAATDIVTLLDGTGDLSVAALDGFGLINGFSDLSVDVLVPTRHEQLDGYGNLGAEQLPDGIKCGGTVVFIAGEFYQSEVLQ